MATYRITGPDGGTYEVTAPDSASQDQVLSYAQQNMGTKTGAAAQVANDAISQGARQFPGQGSDALGGVSQAVLNLLGGGVRGAGSIGATIARPFETAQDNDQRRAGIDANLQSIGAQPNSWMYKAGKLGGEVAGTAAVGGVLGNGVRALGATRAFTGLEPLANGIATGLDTGGFRIGELAGTGAGTVARVGTGAAVGGAAAGMVNPQDAGTGALIGGALPGGVQAFGALGNAARRSVVGQASPEVAELAQKAQGLGIDIPADRIVNSRPLNALSASLNYVPFSGRTATEDAMNSQLNRALSNTFGQDSSNVATALRSAQQKLGGEFDRVLTQNGVNFDQPLLEDLAGVYNKAEAELGPDALKPIANKINEIVQKGSDGVIDGQAAYNIKRDLDRIGSGNNPNAWHALELKKVLMNALDRSLGPDQAAAFATTRQQYGNMLDLQKLIPNGVEGQVSAARLANLRNINNDSLQGIADIAAQFVKPREGMHGAAQRVFGVGIPSAAALGYMGLPYAPAVAGAGMAAAGIGRVANAALNSNVARQMALGLPLTNQAAPSLFTTSAYRALPLFPDQ